MNNATRAVLDDIRRRDSSLGQVASRCEADAALNDCRTLLMIIDELQSTRLRIGISRTSRRRGNRKAYA